VQLQSLLVKKLGKNTGVITDKWFVFAIVALILSLYCVSFKPTRAVSMCHNRAQESAKNSMQARAQQNPQNADYQLAMQAGMFVDQDYLTFYRNCLRSKGYDPTSK
jgi:hypothetical protein